MKYRVAISLAEYSRFKTHPATRLYVHTFNGSTLEIETERPRQLAKDLAKVIEFGATSAAEVLGLTHER